MVSSFVRSCVYVVIAAVMHTSKMQEMPQPWTSPPVGKSSGDGRLLLKLAIYAVAPVILL